jgi:hypothetical protein
VLAAVWIVRLPPFFLCAANGRQNGHKLKLLFVSNVQTDMSAYKCMPDLVYALEIKRRLFSDEAVILRLFLGVFYKYV